MFGIEIEPLAVLIGIILGVYTIYQSLIANTRQNRIDVSNETSMLTTVSVKLESIANVIYEIKSEVTGLKNEVRDNREKMLLLQEDLKAMHRRLSAHEKAIAEHAHAFGGTRHDP